MRERLFVSAAGIAPRIARYAGRGSLKGWLRATAVRALVDETRALRAGDYNLVVEEEVLLRLPDAGDDPHIDHLKRSIASDDNGVFKR